MASALAAQRQAQMAFLGAVAHDLRNPLSALQLSVAVLRVGDPASSPALVRQTVERIERQLTRMERMLGDFLDIARIEAGQLELRVEEHDAGMLVAEVAELFQATSRDHHVEVRLPAHPVPIHCDHLRIEQVITNLISNAIKYSPTGSPIEVGLVPRTDEIELRVTDHGVGISAEDRAHLFEPFRRLRVSAQGVPGMGLGLYAVHKIVEAHGGRITVESAPGAGSTFRVWLPRSPGG
jgi:signal transduction histidine kinase